MNRQKLTQTLVNRFEYQSANNERYILWDSATQGLGLRIYPSGCKAYVVSYRHHGRKRLMTFGTHGIDTLSQARDRARIELGRVGAQVDPLADRQKASAGDTVRDLSIAYMERHTEPNKKTWAGDQRMIDKWVLPHWGSLKAKSATEEFSTSKKRVKKFCESHESSLSLAKYLTKSIAKRKHLAKLAERKHLATLQRLSEITSVVKISSAIVWKDNKSAKKYKDKLRRYLSVYL